MIELRDYQRAMLDAVRAHWASGTRRVLGVLPTGGGKTECAIALLAEATQDARALVIVDRKVLVHQWVERLERNGIDRVGILQGENTMRVYERILVATAQTIRARGVPEQVSTIVIDESHIWHQTHDSVLESLGDARVLGLTATPLREGLGLRFNAMVVGTSIKTLIERALLVPPRYFAPKADAIESALGEVSVQAGDFATGELSRAMRGAAIIGDVVGEWQRRGEDRQSIAFCVDKAHACELAAQFVAAGIPAEVVIDETSDEERARIFAAFEAREARVLCSVGVLAIGFDSPIAACAILARPTLSYSLYLQQGGRVLRPAPGKVDAIVLDHAGNTSRFGLLEEFSPPHDLSLLDRHSDRKQRSATPMAWVCRACEAVNALACDICTDCGAARRRVTRAIVIDGELHHIECAENETPPPGILQERLRETYRMHVWYGQHKGMRDPLGWAYHTTLRRFHLEDVPKEKRKLLVPWYWRGDEPLAPDVETARWLKADFQRQLIARRYA